MSSHGSGGASESVWYFAYGANMSSRVLARRGVVPQSSEPAHAAGWCLRFSLPGVPWLEPGFANLEPEPGGVTHGVLHRMRRHDLARLDRVEAGGYRHRNVDVKGDRSGSVGAIAYVYPRPRAGRLPSRRYRDVLADGAREQGLPAQWVEMLASHPCRHVPLVSDVVGRGFRVLQLGVEGVLRVGTALFPDRAPSARQGPPR